MNVQITRRERAVAAFRNRAGLGNCHVEVGADKEESPDTVWIIGFKPQIEGDLRRVFEDRLGFDRVKTVSKLFVLELLGLALSEKQIPQIVENIKKRGELLEPLEGDGMRPRQVRYRAALRPDSPALSS